MFGAGPSVTNVGFGGFPAMPSTSAAPPQVMPQLSQPSLNLMPNLPSTSAQVQVQAPDAAGIPNEYLAYYAMLLNQGGASGAASGLGSAGGSGNASGSNFLMLNQVPQPAPAPPPPPPPQPQPVPQQPQTELQRVQHELFNAYAAIQASQNRQSQPDYAALALADAQAQQRRQSASFTSPAIHQSPQQPPNQQISTLSALQALQQSPQAALFSALMPPPPQPQQMAPPPPPQPQLPSHLFSEELLNALQQEIRQREFAAAQAQQQAAQIQAFQQALQQGVIPANQTQHLLALLQQQLQNQALRPPVPQTIAPSPQMGHGLSFGTPNLGTPRPPMTPQMVMTPTLPPGLNLLQSIRPSTSTTPNSGMRFIGGDDIHKKLSQSSLISASPHGASPPKRNSVSSSQPIPRKISMVSTPQMQPSGSYQSPPRLPSNFSQAMPPPQLPQQMAMAQQPSSSTQLPPPQPMDSMPSSSSAVPGPSNSRAAVANRAPGEQQTGLPIQPYYPTHFFKGTSFQLADGHIKLVEELQHEDFANSVLVKGGLRLCIGKVIDISPTACCKQIVVRYLTTVDDHTIEGVLTANCEYPFYEVLHGWTSFDPAKTMNLYGLNCRSMLTGDKCFLLCQPSEAPEGAAGSNQPNRAPNRQHIHSLACGSDCRPASRSSPMQRLNRKSIPPPLNMDGASTSTSSAPQPHPPPTERIISSSSMTPSSSTISAPAATRQRPVFNLESSASNPNTMELYSAPAAMDDLTVAGEPTSSTTEASAMEVDPSPSQSQPGPSTTSVSASSTTAQPSQPSQPGPSTSNSTENTDVILDFNI